MTNRINVSRAVQTAIIAFAFASVVHPAHAVLSESVRTENLQATMDPAKGCITLTDRDGTPLLVSSVAVTTGSGASVDLLAKSRNLEISSKHALFDWRGEMLILHGDCPNLGVEFKATINVLHKERGAIYNLEVTNGSTAPLKICLLYTSDAADE